MPFLESNKEVSKPIPEELPVTTGTFSLLTFLIHKRYFISSYIISSLQIIKIIIIMTFR